MSLTESTMLALGSSAPDFSLVSTGGEQVRLSDFSESELLVVVFVCNHCPYVIHIAPTLAKIADRYLAQGVGFIAINSNDTEAYPADSFELMAAEKALRGYNFPYVIDEQQSVAKAYGAACTPDLYVFDASRALVYRGQFDDTRPHRISSGNYDTEKTPATGAGLTKVLESLLAGEQVGEQQTPSMGCNIKWKPGNEPDYYG